MQSQRKMPFIIGVTGGIGSGKSAVTDFLSQQGIKVVDADVAARTVVEPGQSAVNDIKRRYGSDILLKDGSLNRKKLRYIIFNDQTEKEWLEKLLHPKINQLLRQQLADASSPYVIFVSPLLTETSQHTMADRVLVVDVPEATQLKRSMARDGMSEEQTQRIIKSQASRKHRLALADDVIDNNGTLDQLHSALSKLHQNYLSLAKDRKGIV